MRPTTVLSLHTAFALALVGGLACSTGPDAEPVVELLVLTDKAVYSLAADTAATTTLVNTDRFPFTPP